MGSHLVDILTCLLADVKKVFFRTSFAKILHRYALGTEKRRKERPRPDDGRTTLRGLVSRLRAAALAGGGMIPCGGLVSVTMRLPFIKRKVKIVLTTNIADS